MIDPAGKTHIENSKIPDFRAGDTINVFYKIIEGGKSRIQPYSGIVLSKKGMGINKSVTIRKIGADGIGVERILPIYSPNIEKIEILKRGKVRRAKLYYLRDKKGRAATKVKELIKISATGPVDKEVEPIVDNTPIVEEPTVTEKVTETPQE